jgi:D-alanyl-D-alanine carboxypeptidase/D-alanyl-D-alanine-endopeptidase (penicillin-binding protein 4)
VTDDQTPSRRSSRQSEGSKARRAPREKPPKAPADATPLVDENGNPIAPKGGILAAIRKHPTAWLFSTLAVVFVLLGTGAVFAGIAYGSTPEAAATPEPSDVPPRPQPTADALSTRLRTCSVSGLTTDPRLMNLFGAVERADTGELLFSKSGDTAERTGSVLKVFTASAAIAVLGADFQIPTRVFTGSTANTIVLVGYGDPTLSAMPAGTESVYTGAPKLSSLASATLAAYEARYPGQQITDLVLDSSYWNPSDKWDATWKRSEQTIGYHSEVTALQVDGDRADPTKQTSPRGTDPIGRAGTLFLRALQDADSHNQLASNVRISVGTNISGTQLAEVKSQPLRVLIKQMLLNSDSTAASLQQAIPSALWPDDPTTAASVVIKDGSGLSESNGVPPIVMATFMRRVADGVDNLDIVRDALPVAGKSGTLASRFSGDNAAARGHVTAKTGWIDTAYTLSGFVDTVDGTRLTFAFYAVGGGIKDNAKDAIDTLVTGVYNCGDNLASF